MPPAVSTAPSNFSGGGSASRWGGAGKSPANITKADLADMASRLDEEERKRRKRQALQSMGVTLPDDADPDEALELFANEFVDQAIAARPRGPVIVPAAGTGQGGSGGSGGGADPTVLDRFAGLAMAPTSYFTRDVAVPVAGAGERVTQFMGNAPLAIGLGTAGMAADYFLGDDLGLMDASRGFAKRATGPTFTDRVLRPQAEENVQRSLRLRGMAEEEPMDIATPATPVPSRSASTGAQSPASGQMTRPMGITDQNETDDMVFNPATGGWEPRPPLNPLMEQTDQPPATPTEQLRRMASTVNPVDGAGDVMQSATELIASGGLQMGSDDAYLDFIREQQGQEDEQPMDIMAPAGMEAVDLSAPYQSIAQQRLFPEDAAAEAARPRQATALSPERMTRDEVYAAIAAAYGNETAKGTMDDQNPRNTQRLLQGAVNAINRDPMRRERYDAVLTKGPDALNTFPGSAPRQGMAAPSQPQADGDIMARLRAQGFNRDLTEPEQRRLEKFLGGIREQGYPNYAVFSDQRENDMLARATGTPEGPHPGASYIFPAGSAIRSKEDSDAYMQILSRYGREFADDAIRHASSGLDSISDILAEYDKAEAAGRRPTRLDFARAGAKVRGAPTNAPLSERTNIAQLDDPVVGAERYEGKPLTYTQQNPEGALQHAVKRVALAIENQNPATAEPWQVSLVQEALNSQDGVNAIGQSLANSLNRRVDREEVDRLMEGMQKMSAWQEGPRPMNLDVPSNWASPRYPGQEPTGSWNGKPIYTDDEVSARIRDLRNQSRIEQEAMEIDLRNRFGPGVTAQDVSVMSADEARRRAEAGAKRADDEIDRDMQMARNSGDYEFTYMLNQAMAEPEPEQRRRTWVEWWAGKDKPGTPAPKIKGAPEGETLERRVQARLDAQAIYARYGRVAGVDEANEYLRLAYGAPPIGSRDYAVWARQNPDVDKQIKSSLFHAERLGVAEPKLLYVR